MRVRCPHCQNPIELVDDASLSDIACPSCNSRFSLAGDTSRTEERPGEQTTIGRFQLARRLGMGAFGEVWQANDTELDRAVAVKLPRKQSLSQSETEQFLREARAAAQLKHPGIVSVHEVGQQDGRIYIVSDLVQGVDLSERLEAGHFSPREAAELCIKIAQALHHAHEQGVIHRDLKPSNIMLDGDGQPHVMDFGLAKREAGEITMTIEGQLLGTPAYMSPEQAKGDAHDADRRSDVFTLGVILFELLTGERPFRGKQRMLLHQIINDDAPNSRRLNANIPRDLDTICLKCLEKEPGKRYQTAKDLSDELRRFLDGEAIHARPISKLNRTWRWSKRNPAIASLLAIVFVTLTLGAAISTSQWQRAEVALETAEDEKKTAQDERNKANDARKVAEDAKKKAEDEEKNADEARAAAELANTSLEQELRRATAFRLAAESQAVRENLPQRSVLLAVEAVQATRSRKEPVHSRVEQNLRDALRSIDGTLLSGHDATNVLAFSDSGNRLVTGGRDKQLTVWKLDASGRGNASIDVNHPAAEMARIRISADGKRLVGVNAQSRTAYIWDLTREDTRSAPRQVPEDGGKIEALALSADGSRLAISRDGPEVHVWDLDDAQAAPIILRGYEATIRAMALNANGERLVTTDDGPTARTWDLTADNPSESVKVLQGHEGNISRIALTPDGRRLVTGAWDRTARVWNLQADDPCESVLILDAYQVVDQIALSEDGERLVTATIEPFPPMSLEPPWPSRMAIAWRIEPDGANASATVLNGERGDFSTLALSSDGKRLVTRGPNGTVRVWDLASPDPNTSSVLLRGHESGVKTLAISADGSRLVTESFRSQIRLWDLDSHGCGAAATALYGSEFEINLLSLSADERWLLTGFHHGGNARIWDLTNGAPFPTARLIDGSFDELALSKDGTMMASASNADDEHLVHVWMIGPDSPKAPSLALKGHDAWITELAFSADGRQLASASLDHTARIWNLESPNVPPAVLRGHTAPVHELAISDVGQRVITASDDQTVRVWNSQSTIPNADSIVVARHDGRIIAIAASADGRRLATHTDAGKLRVWDLSTRKPVGPTHEIDDFGISFGTDIVQIAMSADGSRLAAGGDYAMLMTWNLNSDNLATSAITLAGHQDTVRVLALSTDGRWLASGSRDGTARLWDLADDDPSASAQVFHSRAGHIVALQLGATGKRLVTGDTAGTACVWPLRIEDLLVVAKRVVGRELTDEEREMYGLEGAGEKGGN